MANGARGYPERPATDEDLAGKFRSCAARAVSVFETERVLSLARSIGELSDVRIATAALARDRVSTP
jgi:hypothetical protein